MNAKYERPSVPEIKEMMNMLRNNSYRREDFGDPIKQLWICVILQGIVDLREGKHRHYEDAREFFLGNFVKKVCNWVDLDYNKIIENLKSQELL